MTTADGQRPDPFGPPGTDAALGDGPVIDPRDPLGLGDLPLDEPDDHEPDEHEPDEHEPDEHEPDEHGPDEHEPDGGEPDGGETVDRATDGPPASTTSDDEPSSGTLPEDRDGPEPADADADGPVDHPTDEAAEDASDPTGRAADHPTDHPTDHPDGPPPSRGPVRPPRSGWARLGHAMRPRTTQGQLITAGLCALLGFALVVQVRQATDTQLGALRQNDLVRLLDETTTRTDELEQESLDLQRERDELLSGSDRQQAALDAARRTAAMQGILTGRLPATGPGVRITLTEPDGEIRPATMLHVLEELRNAGAEAMELNGHRVTASSAFTGTRGAIELDGVTITSPFRWSVIGDPDTIAPALEIPGGALARVRADLGRGTVEKSDRVDVTATRLPSDPLHATPVEDQD